MAAKEGVLLQQTSLLFENKDYNQAPWEQAALPTRAQCIQQTFVSVYGKNPVKNVNQIYGKPLNFTLLAFI